MIPIWQTKASIRSVIYINLNKHLAVDLLNDISNAITDTLYHDLNKEVNQYITKFFTDQEQELSILGNMIKDMKEITKKEEKVDTYQKRVITLRKRLGRIKDTWIFHVITEWFEGLPYWINNFDISWVFIYWEDQINDAYKELL